MNRGVIPVLFFNFEYIISYISFTRANISEELAASFFKATFKSCSGFWCVLVGEMCRLHTYPFFRGGLSSKTTCARSENLGINDRPPQKKKQFFSIFSVFFFLCRNTVTELLPFISLPTLSTSRGLARRTVRVVDSFDAVVHWRVPVMYFYLGMTPRIYKTAKYEPAKIEGWMCRKVD